MEIMRVITTILMAFIVIVFVLFGVCGKTMSKNDRMGWTFSACVLMLAIYFMWF